jgi:glycosyltransferase involved in cell wall biosynthesis
MTTPSGRRIAVVGSGTRFLSGISVYSVRLANALAERNKVSLVTMRRLLPERLYPGWKRVGADLADLQHDRRVSVFDGIDWFWLPSLLRGGFFLARHRPQVLILEWWTGTVLHSYIALALLARLLGAKVVVEFHEIVETGEANIPVAARYISAVAPILMRLADGFAVHSAFDRELALKHWRLGRRRPIEVLPHGPHDHYQSTGREPQAIREAPAGTTNLLFFGVIRPYKGLEHLVQAFEAIPDSEIDRYWLTVAGETWEGWTLPTDLIEKSPRRDRITFVNRYLTDEELDGYLRGADAVVLPYLRSSLSGPLHVAMGYGLPIVMSDVGGNAEAAAGYGGIVLVKPADPTALAAAIAEAAGLAGQEFAHPHSWQNTADAYEQLFDRLAVESSS